MSVCITISDDGEVEAKHNSGHVLWTDRVIAAEQDYIDSIEIALMLYHDYLWDYTGDSE